MRNLALVLTLLLVPSIVLASRQFPAGLVVHLDAFNQDDIRLSADGDQRVLEWKNKVGSNQWFVVNTSISCPRWEWSTSYFPDSRPCRPLYVADQINHGGVVRFDGVEDYMEMQGNFRTRGSNSGSDFGNAHIFIVARGEDRANFAKWQRLISAHDNNKAWDDWQTPNWEVSGPRQNTGAELNFGAQLLVQKKTQVHLKNIRLATKWNGQWTSRIELGEVLIFERILTDSEALIVSDMLEIKWGFKEVIPVNPDPKYTVPTAGYANYVARLRGSDYDFPVKKYLSVPQTEKREWEGLLNTFTIEAWFKMDTPENNPEDGSCCQFADGTPWSEAGIWVNPFLPILSRHPSDYHYYNNAFAHFNLQLTRVPSGVAIAAWAGCGCEDPEDEDTCDVGYTVSSDSRYLPQGQRVYVVPNRWYHVAVSFDGDDTSIGFETKTARMYVNGKYLVSTSWADPNLYDPLKKPGVCRGKGMIIPRDTQMYIGFLQNHDGRRDALPDGTPVNRDYGFEGKVDEIRIWNRVLSPTEIASWWDVTLMNLKEDGEVWSVPRPEGLVAYYPFNSTLLNAASEDGLPQAQLIINPEVVEDVEEAEEEFYGTPWELPNYDPLEVINSRVHVVGRNLKNENPEPAEGKEFYLGGFYPDAHGNPLWLTFKIEAVSPWLGFALEDGSVKINYDYGGVHMSVEPESLPTMEITGTQELTIYADCDNSTCANLGLTFDNYWIQYRPTWTNPDNSSDWIEGLPAKVYFSFEADCQAEYDACGVCGGDGRTCQCVWYLNMKSSRMAHTLLNWSVDHILEKVNCSISALKDTLTVVQNPHWEQEQSQPEIIDQIEYMMGFYNNCLNDYCREVQAFQDQLVSYLEAIGKPIVGEIPK